ncbi:MAG: ABC transporter permease [Chitinophagales bacterium]
MFVFLKILQAGFILALQELWNNKLRTFLSILGITIGIFCVISVQMMVESVERNVRSSFERLGNDVLYIDRFPWDEDPSVNWWKYIKRPYPNYREFLAVKEKVTQADAVSIRIIVSGKDLKYQNNVAEDLRLIAGSHDLGAIFNLELADGRYFSPTESHLGNKVILLGSTLAEQLFPTISDPTGKEVRLMGHKLTIIGILKKEGKSLLGDGFDNVAMIPYNFMRRYVDVNSRSMRPFIGIKSAEGVPLAALKDEITGVLRAERKLKPKEDNNFAINELSLLSSILDSVFSVINVAGWLIGIFAILVGGFGIANIMFVSVKERTGIIGIKKSLGAKNHFILFEFLIEAICLCLLGGLLGLALVYGLGVLANSFIESFQLMLSTKNVIYGLSISLVIGVIAGYIPAIVASRMNPVEAIRQNF